ncbi:hypothetical protein AWC38_SpisGene4217 [Stylophora pistillata]|uniref:Reverse transcriptase domain-containing protein n=1 Tax=Stylophora pistillata TaxID=50429 RepID=A0A2B4SJV8_STYPI|nr:hypothetical protein AWC38_SpisGene4217 [Stylophora pistillata]
MTDETEEDQVERKSEKLEKAYVKTAEEVLGYKKKKNKPWLSKENWALVDQRKAIKQKLIGARSERLKQRWQDEYRQKDREIKRQMEIELPDEIEETDTSEHSREEVRKAIRYLKSGKAPGIDNIPAELLKADIDYATTKVKEIIGIVWRDEKTPRKWRKGLIVKLPKKVVDGQDTMEWFKIKTGVKQGCNMSGLLFILVVDWVIRNTLKGGHTGIRRKFTTKIEDLDLADDIGKNQIMTAELH